MGTFVLLLQLLMNGGFYQNEGLQIFKTKIKRFWIKQASKFESESTLTWPLFLRQEHHLYPILKGEDVFIPHILTNFVMKITLAPDVKGLCKSTGINE